MAYVPPHKRKTLPSSSTPGLSIDSDPELQLSHFNTLRRTLNTLINKVNLSNLEDLLPEFFNFNIVRARGIFCHSLIHAQQSSLSIKLTRVYACIVAVLNTKLPEIGMILVARLVGDFRRGMKMNNKKLAVGSVQFIAELINQRVVNELLALEIIQVLLGNDTYTESSVEVAVQFTKQIGQFLQQNVPKGLHFVFETFRSLLQKRDLNLSKRTQYEIETLFNVRRDKFEKFPILLPELDLVEEDDQITHQISLDQENLAELKHDELDVFQLDPNYTKNEEFWAQLRQEILGEESEEDGSEETEPDVNEENAEVDTDEEEEEEEGKMENTMTELDTKLISNVNAGNRPSTSTARKEDSKLPEDKNGIKDMTEADLVSLRRVIYLTIMSSMDFEECCHKILKMDIPVGLEMEVVLMLIDCCSQELTFNRFFGLLSTRLCMLNAAYNFAFVKAFAEKFETCHRFETNPLRNIAKLFSFLLYNEAVSWPDILKNIKLNEEDTTSSSRIFIKQLLQDLSENMGLDKLKRRLLPAETSVEAINDEEAQEMVVATQGMFPRDDLVNTRFAINFYTLIGLGKLTDSLREFLNNPPEEIVQKTIAKREQNVGDDGDESSSGSEGENDASSSNSSSGSESDSDEESKSEGKRSYEGMQDVKIKQEDSASESNRRKVDSKRELERKMKEIEDRQPFITKQGEYSSQGSSSSSSHTTRRSDRGSRRQHPHPPEHRRSHSISQAEIARKTKRRHQGDHRSSESTSKASRGARRKTTEHSYDESRRGKNDERKPFEKRQQRASRDGYISSDEHRRSKKLKNIEERIYNPVHQNFKSRERDSADDRRSRDYSSRQRKKRSRSKERGGFKSVDDKRSGDYSSRHREKSRSTGRGGSKSIEDRRSRDYSNIHSKRSRSKDDYKRRDDTRQHSENKRMRNSTRSKTHDGDRLKSFRDRRRRAHSRS